MEKGKVLGCERHLMFSVLNDTPTTDVYARTDDRRKDQTCMGWADACLHREPRIAGPSAGGRHPDQCDSSERCVIGYGDCPSPPFQPAQRTPGLPFNPPTRIAMRPNLG